MESNSIRRCFNFTYLVNANAYFTVNLTILQAKYYLDKSQCSNVIHVRQVNIPFPRGVLQEWWESSEWVGLVDPRFHPEEANETGLLFWSTKVKPAVKTTETSLMCVFVLLFVLSVGILDPYLVRINFAPGVQHLCLPAVASSCVPARTSRADCGRTLTCRYSPDPLEQHNWCQQKAS